MMFPPKAGRVCLRYFVSGSISRPVQSAVNPASMVVATVPAKSDPEWWHRRERSQVYIPNEVNRRLRIRVGTIFFEQRAFHDIDLLRSIGDNLLANFSTLSLSPKSIRRACIRWYPPTSSLRPKAQRRRFRPYRIRVR